MKHLTLKQWLTCKSFYIGSYICDLIISLLDRKVSLYHLRHGSLQIQHTIERTYKVVNAVNAMRGLTLSEMNDVVNSLMADYDKLFKYLNEQKK